MKARLVAPLLIVAALAVAAAPAQAAHKKPTNRARIHALEKRMKRLLALVDQQAADLRVAQVAAVEGVSATSTLRCFFAVGTDPFALAGAPPLFAQSPATGAPALWVAVISPACLSRLPDPAKAYAQLVVHSSAP